MSSTTARPALPVKPETPAMKRNLSTQYGYQLFGKRLSLISYTCPLNTGTITLPLPEKAQACGWKELPSILPTLKQLPSFSMKTSSADMDAHVKLLKMVGQKTKVLWTPLLKSMEYIASTSHLIIPPQMVELSSPTECSKNLFPSSTTELLKVGLTIRLLSFLQTAQLPNTQLVWLCTVFSLDRKWSSPLSLRFLPGQHRLGIISYQQGTSF